MTTLQIIGTAGLALALPVLVVIRYVQSFPENDPVPSEPVREPASIKSYTDSETFYPIE